MARQGTRQTIHLTVADPCSDKPGHLYISPMRVVRSRCCARNGQRRVQQPRQITQRSDIDVRCNADVQGRAGQTVEHPHRNLKPALRRRSCRTAAENFPARPSYDLMNVNMAPRPRVPRIKNFADIGIVGVPSPCCTTRGDLTRTGRANPGRGLSADRRSRSWGGGHAPP